MQKYLLHRYCPWIAILPHVVMATYIFCYYLNGDRKLGCYIFRENITFLRDLNAFVANCITFLELMKFRDPLNYSAIHNHYFQLNINIEWYSYVKHAIGSLKKCFNNFQRNRQYASTQYVNFAESCNSSRFSQKLNLFSFNIKNKQTQYVS